MRYVVTSGAGLVGTSLCQALARAGHDVVCADRADRLAGTLGSPWSMTRVEYDLARGSVSPGLLDGCDVLVHLAHRGLPSPPHAGVAREASDNIGGGFQLLEAARTCGVERVLFASSGGTVYGRVAHVPVRESAQTEPISAYGVTKLALEQALRLYATDFGLTCVSLRIGNAVGEGQFRGAGVGAPAKFLAAVDAERPIVIWGDGSIVRDYVNVDDIVDAFVTASVADLESGSYNVGSGIGYSLLEVLDLVRTVTGTSPVAHFEPSRSFDVPAIVLDTSRFTSATGWRPQVALEDGMSRMWAYLQSMRR